MQVWSCTQARHPSGQGHPSTRSRVLLSTALHQKKKLESTPGREQTITTKKKRAGDKGRVHGRALYKTRWEKTRIQLPERQLSVVIAFVLLLGDLSGVLMDGCIALLARQRHRLNDSPTRHLLEKGGAFTHKRAAKRIASPTPQHIVVPPQPQTYTWYVVYIYIYTYNIYILTLP